VLGGLVVAYRGSQKVERVTLAAGRTNAKLATVLAGKRHTFVVYAGESPASRPTKAVKPKP
jgi:hypothetical protein